MRRIRTSLRAGAVAAAALMAGALLTAPASPAAVPASAPAAAPASTRTLAGVLQALDRTARIPGTAWGIDPAAGRVVIWLDQTVTGAKLATLTAAVSAFSGAVRLERMAGTLAPRVQGGDTVYPVPGWKCTVGFNARDSSTTYYFVSSGHCASTGATVYVDSGHTTVLGTVIASSFPGNDYLIAKYTNPAVSHPGSVRLTSGSQDIVSAANAYVGEPVTRVGATTGVHSGTVTALNVTVNYAEGTVSGLIKTNLCSEAGDSGGPVFDGTKAIGMVSGGSGNCSTGGTTFAQPVTEPLAAYGLTVY
jgi:streptogrisin D